MIEILGFRVEKREHSNHLLQVLMVLLAIIVALLISGLLILSAGADVGKAFAGLYGGAFGSKKALIETLVKATPLILTGLAATIAFRGKVMNIGAEGQFLAGAITGYWAILTFSSLSPVYYFSVILFSAFIGGAICGLIPGLLKGFLKVDETIVTVMMNYVIEFILSFLMSGPWQASGKFYKFSEEIPISAHYGLVIPNTRLHVGFIVAIVASVVVYWLLQKTRLGYEIRSIGLNPAASKFKGINVSRTIIIIMIISGGIAGLGGIGEVIGIQHRLRMDISNGAGFTGIIIAMLAGLNPLAVIVVAVFMGGLLNGSNRMQIFSNIPTALVYAMQAIVLLSLLSFQVLAKYRIRRVTKVE